MQRILHKDAMEKEESQRKIEYGRVKSYEFEAAIKKRDSIISRLAAHMNQSRKEMDQILEEFFQLTERSEKVQIQDQHASKTLQSSTHSSAAEELVLLKKQVYYQQQLLEQQYHLLKYYQKKEEELKNEVTSLQVHKMEQDKELEHANNIVQEKQAIIDDLHERKTEEENKSAVLQNKLESTDKLVADLRQQLIEKDQQNQSLKVELASSKKTENHYLLIIKQFMGIFEDLQQKNYNDILIDTGTEQSTKREARRKLDHIQVELDKMYGREIMHMKEELIQQHESQLEGLQAHHNDEMESVLSSYCTEYPNAMECLQKADTRNMLPLNAHNNGREEIGTGDKEMKTSRQSVCLPPENQNLLIPSRLIWFDQARPPEAEVIQPYRLQKQGLGQVSMFYHDPHGI